VVDMLFLIILIIILSILLGISIFYLIRFVGYIISIEDDLAEALEIHERTLETFDKLLNMQMFFDSPQIQKVAVDVLNDVKVCKLATTKIITNFTRLSKNKYVQIVEEDDDRT
jgi:hypothetical protein